MECDSPIKKWDASKSESPSFLYMFEDMQGRVKSKGEDREINNLKESS